MKGKKNDPFRVLFISDLHSGHRVGLTPPSYQNYPDNYIALRKMLWDFYVSKVEENKPYDLVVPNGDITDGKGPRSGGTEQITCDFREQAIMGVECIKVADCEKVRCTYGTGYHTGSGDDHERQVIDNLRAEGMDAEIHSQLFLKVHGKNINVKHKISASALPHLRLTALAREILQNRIWWMKGTQPKADLLLRAHVHYAEGPITHDGCIGITQPALQGLGSKFGARECAGTVDFGITVINIFPDGEITCKIHAIEGHVQADTVEDLTGG